MTQTLQYQTAQAIDDAATLIETKGWCRGRYQDGDRHCTVGALIETAPGDVYGLAYDAIRSEILSSGYKPQGCSVIPSWNDAQRDRRKVVRLLRRTARKVRRGAIPVQ